MRRRPVLLRHRVELRTFDRWPALVLVAVVSRRRRPGRDADALVFASMRGGGHLTLGQARYTFQKAVAAVDGCAGVRLHDLRHTCASLAISSGANVNCRRSFDLLKSYVRSLFEVAQRC
jgi:integrase